MKASGRPDDLVEDGVAFLSDPHQRRHAHSVEMAREGVPLNVTNASWVTVALRAIRGAPHEPRATSSEERRATTLA